MAISNEKKLDGFLFRNFESVLIPIKKRLFCVCCSSLARSLARSIARPVGRASHFSFCHQQQQEPPTNYSNPWRS
jgi:hypothetical protein